MRRRVNVVCRPAKDSNVVVERDAVVPDAPLGVPDIDS